MKNKIHFVFTLTMLFCLACSQAQKAQTTAFGTGSHYAYLKTVLDFGKSSGWSTAVQDQKLAAYLSQRSESQQASVETLIRAATTSSAKFFALKSLLSGDTEPIVQRFISQLNQLSEADQQRYCSVLQKQGLVQKWQYSCSIAVVLTYLMELSPRYAFEVKQVAGWNQAVNNPASNDMGVQEKQLLEQYGGKASLRGDASGKAIGINGPINALVGNLLGVQFYAKQITGSVSDALNNIRGLLDAGMNVPALIDFLPSHASHFILFFREKYAAGQYWYLVYEPWEGKCDWVSTSTIAANSLSPLLTQFNVQLRYYYPTTAR